VAHPSSSVLIVCVSSAFRTVPPSDSVQNRIETVTGAGTYSGKDRITMGTDNGKNRISIGTDSAKCKIAEGIDSGKNKIADSTDNKENEMSLTNSKGIKKQVENRGSDDNREKDFSSSHEKQKELSEDCSNNEENDEDERQEQKEEVPSVSVSDIEIQLKNIEITPCETKNIERQLETLAISVPAGELCERSPVGNEKRYSNNYCTYAVSSPLYFQLFLFCMFQHANCS
jgi:hypothetical protein